MPGSPDPASHAEPPHHDHALADRVAAWTNVGLAALLMLATLPGRTQGLGLITEPMLRDLGVDHLRYAEMNLWATLLGSAACLPAGWLIDRCGLRGVAVVLVLLLAVVVWQMSIMAGGATLLFAMIFLTRALGQSALSVAGITAVGKTFGLRAGWAMGVFSVLLSVFFAIAFVAVGGAVISQGWRAAWGYVAVGLIPVALLTFFLLREPATSITSSDKTGAEGRSLAAALRTRLFWVFAGAVSLFGLVSSGFGLFNEAVLAERGFDARTFHTFLAVMTLFALAGQMLCGWLSLFRPLPKLLAWAMFGYAGGLAALPLLRTHAQLWVFAAVFGIAAGFITVIFFAIWGQAFGRAHLGRIQGAAQMLTVFASAIGPLPFAQSHASAGSYTPLLQVLAAVVLGVGLIAWRTPPGATMPPAPVP